MQYPITFLLLIYSGLVLCQETEIYGIVIDEETRVAIPYANIGIIGKAFGTVSNEEGRFTLKLKEDLRSEDIQITHIAYEQSSRAVDAFPKAAIDTIYLKASSINVSEVVVAGEAPSILGIKSSKSSAKGYFKVKGLGGEAGTFIKNDGTCKVHAFNINIVECSFERLKFRINFYSVKDQVPDELLYSNIYFAIEKGQIGELNIDLNPFNVYLESDFVVSIELLDMQYEEDEDPNFLFSAYKDKKTFTYTKLISMDKWETVKKYGLCFWLKTTR